LSAAKDRAYRCTEVYVYEAVRRSREDRFRRYRLDVQRLQKPPDSELVFGDAEPAQRSSKHNPMCCRDCHRCAGRVFCRRASQGVKHVYCLLRCRGGTAAGPRTMASGRSTNEIGVGFSAPIRGIGPDRHNLRPEKARNRSWTRSATGDSWAIEPNPALVPQEGCYPASVLGEGAGLLGGHSTSRSGLHD